MVAPPNRPNLEIVINETANQRGLHLLTCDGGGGARRPDLETVIHDTANQRGRHLLTCDEDGFVADIKLKAGLEDSCQETSCQQQLGQQPTTAAKGPTAKSKNI